MFPIDFKANWRSYAWIALCHLFSTQKFFDKRNATIMDKSQICTCSAFAHTIPIQLYLANLPPPFNVENKYFQFHLIFNTVLGGEGGGNMFLKG